MTPPWAMLVCINIQLFKVHLQVQKGNKNIAPGINQGQDSRDSRQKPLQTDDPDRRTKSQKRKTDQDKIVSNMKKRRIADANTTCDFKAYICRSSTPAPETSSQTDKQTEERKSSANPITTTNPVIS